MADPAWLGYGFAALMTAVGAFSLTRLAAVPPAGRGRRHPDITTGHVLMAFAMVGMLVPRWNVLPVGLWELVFAVMATWFLAQAVQATTGRTTARRGMAARAGRSRSHARHYLVHAVMACTMLYTYWLGMPVAVVPRPGVGGMSGSPAGAGDPGLTLLFMTMLLASAVRQLDGVERAAPRRPAALAATGAAGSALGVGATGSDGPAGCVGAAPADPVACPWLASPLEVACHVAMCLAMAYMLVLML